MRRLIYFIFASVAVLVFVQCSDWTEMENKFTEPVNINSEDYYRALREYKRQIILFVLGGIVIGRVQVTI